MKRRAGAALLLPGLLAATLANGNANAGPLAVRGADGVEWRINDDDDTRIERRDAEGRLDKGFGQSGQVGYTLGHADAGTTAMRVDAAGRIWVAGTSAAAGTSGPVVMRFHPDGRVDTGWGVGGRNSATPPGQRVVVADILPMADGSVWVAGDVLGSPTGQHAAAWRVKADGALDFSFGTGGLWQRSGKERSRAISLAQAPDGRVALGLETPEGTRTGREIYLLAADGRAPEAGGRSVVDDDDDENDAYLTWTGRAWRWDSGEQVASVSGLPATLQAEGPSASAYSQTGQTGPASDALDGGHGGLNPFGGASIAAPAEAVPEESPWGLVALGGTVVAGLLALWWRRARADRTARDRSPPGQRGKDNQKR